MLSICNSTSSTNIVYFLLSLSSFPSRFLKHVYYKQVFTPLSAMLHFPLKPTWDLTIPYPIKYDIEKEKKPDKSLFL